MNHRCLIRLVCFSLSTAFLTGCVTRRTVTQGGQTVESGYVVKHPIKDQIIKKDGN